MNAIESVSYQVNHTATGTGSILAVTADVIVSDVALIVDAANVDETSSIGFKQSFGVQFQSVDAAELSTANGNLVRRYVLSKISLSFTQSYICLFCFTDAALEILVT